MEPLKKNKKLDVVEILKDLDKYEPRRRNWVWRKRAEDQHMYQFEYHELSEPLKQSVPLPPAKSKKIIDGGYDGKVVTFGIRPEDVYDSEMYIETSPQSVFESTVKVYELLGAEVFLYFDLEEFSITARVDPRTTARPGDNIKFAFDTEKIHVFDKDTEETITN